MLARIRDTEIFFDIDGASHVIDSARMVERPSGFMVHGGPGSDHAGMKARYGALKDRMQLVYFDHRGHGRSARSDPHSYVLDENVEDMEALRRHLGLKTIVSLGVSYGGRVAMAHAARYPETVSHLILVATSAHGGSARRAHEIVAERGTPEQIAMAAEMDAGRIDTEDKLRRYHAVMATLYSRRASGAESAAVGPGIFAPEPFNRAFGPGGFLHALDLRQELPRITAPTLILAGRWDFRCPPEYAEEIHRLIPGSDLRIFEDSGHKIAADEPQKCFDAIAGFLAYARRAA